MNTFELAVIIVGIMSLLNSVAVIALIRQIGLLHLRIQPVPALQLESGPAEGDELILLPAPWPKPGANIHTVAFITTTCRLCAPLMPMFRSLATHVPDDESFTLVVDASPSAAQQYVNGKFDGSVLARPGILKDLDIPGTPFVAVVGNDGRVVLAGGVNTGEQIEGLIEEAREEVARPRIPLASVNVGREE